MTSLFFVCLTSLLLGMRHATDPDHVLAVSTIVSREGSIGRAVRVGAMWGIGHSVTIAVVGTAIIAYRVALSPRVGLSMELAVALMLVLLGVTNLISHDHAAPRFAPVRPFLVGLVHGLAGSAAAALLILSTITDARWAVAYLAVFGVGTLAGMSVVTAAIAAPSLFAARRVVRAQHWIRAASGVLTLAFGFYLVYQITVVGGLFAAAPRWTPG